MNIWSIVYLLIQNLERDFIMKTFCKLIILSFCLVISLTSCGSDDPVVKPDNNPLVLTFSIDHVNIHGIGDGTINVSVAGGQKPYTYLWSTGEKTNQIGGLKAGTYEVTVTDGSNNIVSESVVLTEPSEGDPAPAVSIKNSVGMDLKLITGGSFNMGSTSGQPDEAPVHKVNLTSFYIGVYEVTREDYEAVMNVSVSASLEENVPLGNIDWNEAVEFCQKLSQLEGETYRLPTEAEWEYAARGGHDGYDYVWGNDLPPEVNGIQYANVADESYISNYPLIDNLSTHVIGYNDGFAEHSPVGSFAPNDFGLYDMAGNVMEWCSDWYHEFYYRDSNLNNPTAPSGPSSYGGRSMRGGTYGNSIRYLKIAGRFQGPPTTFHPTLGLRVVKEIN